MGVKDKGMTTKRVWAFIIFIFVLIAAVDIYLYSDSIDRNSITQVIIDSSKDAPLIPWFVGFLMGGLTFHFFDSYKQKRKVKKDNYYEW